MKKVWNLSVIKPDFINPKAVNKLRPQSEKQWRKACRQLNLSFNWAAASNWKLVCWFGNPATNPKAAGIILGLICGWFLDCSRQNGNQKSNKSRKWKQTQNEEKLLIIRRFRLISWYQFELQLRQNIPAQIWCRLLKIKWNLKQI